MGRETRRRKGWGTRRGCGSFAQSTAGGPERGWELRLQVLDRPCSLRMTAFISPRKGGGRGPKSGPLNPRPPAALGRGQACEGSSHCWDPSGPQAPCPDPPNPSSLCISLDCVTLCRDLASLGLQAPLKGAELRVRGRVQQMPGLGCRGQTQMGRWSVPKMLGLPEPHSTPLGGNKIGSWPL